MNRQFASPPWSTVVRRVGVMAFLLLAPLLTGFGPPIMTERTPDPLRLAPADIDAIAAASRPPQIGAAAALVVDMDSGATLYSHRPNEPLPPASTAKLMTALLTLEQAALDDYVVVSEHAAATEGSRMGLAAGERLTVRDLLHGLLLPSGNDAAVALAEHLAGSEPAFVAQMNRRAGELGLSGSRFQNPYGGDADGQVVTASDLVALARVALENPLFRSIVALPAADVAGHHLVNTNELLGIYPGVDGVKTGTSDLGGQCLVVSQTRGGGHRILAVVLGSTDRYADMRALLDFATSGWVWQNSDLPDNALAWARGSDDRPYRLRTTGTSDIFVPAWQAPFMRPLRVLTDTAVMTSTLPVGELRWTVGGAMLRAAPLSVWQGP